MIIKALAFLAKKTYVRIETDGLKRNLKASLFGMGDHLKCGGIVQVEFNNDGTHFVAKKI